MPTLQARERLLAAAVAHALKSGIADLSLREVASAIGTSHRMLIYHFGSREGLLIAVAQAFEETEKASFFDLEPTEDGARSFWKHISNPKLWPQERLFFELYSHALLGRPGTQGFLEGIVETWVAPIADGLVKAGVDKKAARPEARLGLAVVRGLILDLLATGDRKGVNEAYERHLEHVALWRGSTPR